MPSLISPWTISSVLTCTDCHGNNQGPGAGGTGPRGPHGSPYTPLLERQLLVLDDQPESIEAYALCYKCHSRTSILGDTSFPHRIHVAGGERGHPVACTSCHDSHGTVSTPALINFNTLYATFSSNGRLEYVNTGTFRGNCSVTCHGVDHNALGYNGGATEQLASPMRKQRGPARRR